jgi:transcriptional regulator with XRE-family HTH domain
MQGRGKGRGGGAFPGRSLGSAIAKARRDRDLTQADLARQIGLSPSTLSRIENDHELPHRNTLMELVEALELDAQELVLNGRVRRAM